jgi:hypothetical protein
LEAVRASLPLARKLLATVAAGRAEGGGRGGAEGGGQAAGTTAQQQQQPKGRVAGGAAAAAAPAAPAIAATYGGSGHLAHLDEREKYIADVFKFLDIADLKTKGVAPGGVVSTAPKQLY